MTMFGKIMVFVNLALSLLMATWAFGVWSNRIDFSDAKGTTPEQAEGEFRKREKEIDSLGKSLTVDLSGLKSVRDILVKGEDKRREARGWYHNELERMQKAGPGPVKTVVYADKDEAVDTTEGKVEISKGQVLLDKDSHPLLVDAKDAAGKPLKPLESLIAEESKVLSDLDSIQAKHEKQIQEAIQLTKELVGTPGDPGAGTPAVKGLHQRLIDERKKLADVTAEEEVIRPLLINAVVDSELVLKRQRALEGRIKELKGTAVTARDR
jgi:hypothetical protein